MERKPTKEANMNLKCMKRSQNFKQYIFKFTVFWDVFETVISISS